jgi:hypothetical protein
MIPKQISGSQAGGSDMIDIVEDLRATADDTEAVDNPGVAHLLKEAAAAIEMLRADRRWIPVSERLPTKLDADGVPETVLGWYPDYPPAILMVWHTGKEWEDSDGSGQTVKAPTHWMPLPEPPAA